MKIWLHMKLPLINAYLLILLFILPTKIKVSILKDILKIMVDFQKVMLKIQNAKINKNLSFWTEIKDNNISY